MAGHDLKQLAFSVVSNHKVQAVTGGVIAVSVAWYLIAPGFFLGLVFGSFALLIAEAAGLVYLWFLIKPKKKTPHPDKDVVDRANNDFADNSLQEDIQNVPASNDFLEASELVGLMWLSTRPCEKEDDSLQGHGKLRKNVKGFLAHGRCVKLDGLKLLLGGPNSVSEVLFLDGCDVKAYSETDSSKKKWNRKFPVVLRHATREIWMQSKDVFIYFPDGWQKELWTQVLRKAIRIGAAGASSDPGWQSKIRHDLLEYRAKVEMMYPELLSLASAAAMEPKAEGADTADARGVTGFAARTRWRRRLRASGSKASGERSGDDWELAGPGSVPQTSSGPVDRSAVAPPLLSDQDTSGFRGKIKSFVASKRAMLHDYALSKGLSVDGGSDNQPGTVSGGSDITELMDRVKDLDAPILPDSEDEHGKGQPAAPASDGDLGKSDEADPPGKRHAEAAGRTNAPDTAIPRTESNCFSSTVTPLASGAESSNAKRGSVEAEMGRLASVSTEHPFMESAVCSLNFLVARLFFDLAYQETINKKMLAKLDEKLGLILTPAAIGKLSCSKFDFGTSPPLLKSIRPSTTLAGVPDGFYSMDVELTYQGKVTFTIETRLDLKDSPYLMGEGDSMGEGASVLDEVAAESGLDVVAEDEASEVPRNDSQDEGLPESLGASGGGPGDTLEGAADIPRTGSRDGRVEFGEGATPPASSPSLGASSTADAPSTDGGQPLEATALHTGVPGVAASKTKSPPLAGLNLKSSGTSSSHSIGSQGSRRPSRLARSFREMLANMAAGLSQVPLSITVSITAITGTLRIRVPPPPTDRLWVGFVDKPELSLSFVPSIGEKQLKRFPLATKIVDKVKELINRTLVLPACADIPLSFMKADSDDWLPREPRMLPWRPANIPAYASKGFAEAFPGSASDTVSEGARQMGESEVGWEDEPRQDSIAASAPVGSNSKRSFRSEAGQNSSPGIIPAPSWRASQRQGGSPSRRPSFVRNDQPGNRSLLLAAKTSFQTALQRNTSQATSAVAGTPSGDEVPAQPASSALTSITGMRAEVRKAASGLFKGRRESSDAPPNPLVHSKTAPFGPTQLEPAPPEGEHSRSKSEQWSIEEQMTASPSIVLDRISEAASSEETGVRRSSSARDLDGAEGSSSWHATPLAAHMTPRGTDDSFSFLDPVNGASGVSTGSERPSEWHGTEAAKGDMSGPGSPPTADLASANKTQSNDEQASQPSKAWHGGHSTPLVTAPMTSREVALQASTKAIDARHPTDMQSISSSGRQATEEGTLAVAASAPLLGGDEEGRKGSFSMRKDLSENWKNKAKDLVGKLSDKETHAQARQVVGLVVGETKEKAKEKVKRFTSFLKEKQASLHGRNADMEEGL